MKSIAKFYTWFWVIYFPVCIPFQKVVNYDFSDELLMIVLVFYTFFKSQYLVKSRRRLREVATCYALLTFYLLYSFIIDITTPRGIMLDFLQQIRPYSVFYLTWLLAPKFTKFQKKLIIFVMLASFFGYVILFYTANRVVSYFGDGENAVMGQIALCCGMVYYLFSEHTKRNKYIALGIMLLGLLSGKSKYIGECVVFFALVIYIKRRIKFDSPKFILQMSALAVAVLYFTWTKFNIYYVENMQKEDSGYARPETYKVAWRIITQDYIPFGTGYGTFGTIAAAKEYSPLYYKYGLNKIWGLEPENPMFLADAFYPTLAQVGIFGIFFFVIFWKRRIQETNRITDLYSYQMALMAIMALALESTADTSYLSGKGMGYFMILAVCLNSNQRNALIRIKKDESADGGLCAAEQRGGGIGHPNDGTDATVARV